MRITITGFAGEGKTTLARLIQYALADEGFDADVVDDERLFGVQEFEVRLEAVLAKRPPIEIVTQAVLRPRGE